MTPINPDKSIITTSQPVDMDQNTAAAALVELFQSSTDANASNLESSSSKVSSTKRRRITLQEKSPTETVTPTPSPVSPVNTLPSVFQVPPLRSIPLSQLPPPPSTFQHQLLPSPLQLISAPKFTPLGAPSLHQSTALPKPSKSNPRPWEKDEVSCFVETLKSVFKKENKRDWIAVQAEMVKKGFPVRPVANLEAKFRQLPGTLQEEFNSLKIKVWSPDELSCFVEVLKALAKEKKNRDWKAVGTEMEKRGFPFRPAHGYSNKFQDLRKDLREEINSLQPSCTPWTDEVLQRFFDAVPRYTEKRTDWKKVSETLNNVASKSQCYSYWHKASYESHSQHSKWVVAKEKIDLKHRKKD